MSLLNKAKQNNVNSMYVILTFGRDIHISSYASHVCIYIYMGVYVYVYIYIYACIWPFKFCACTVLANVLNPTNAIISYCIRMYNVSM